MISLLLSALVALSLKPSIVYLKNTNFEPRPHGEVPSVIVLHDTEDDNLRRVLGLFTSRKFGKNAHFTVAKDGTIYQTAPIKSRAGHAGKSYFCNRTKVNDFSIGIEIINKGTGKDPYPESQYRSLANLLAWLMGKYNISWDHVTTHSEIARPRGRKSDPRPPFSMGKLRKMTSRN